MEIAKGTLYLGNIKDAVMYEVLDHKYLVDFNYKGQSKIACDTYGFKNLIGLKPSNELIEKVTYIKSKGEWNTDICNNWYTPLLKGEINSSKELKASLNYMYKVLKSGHDVALLCSCYNGDTCIRKVIGDEFRRLGFSINVR